MSRISSIMCVGFFLVPVSCAELRRPTFNRVEAGQCRAIGGYESRAPSGAAICQVRYADAGKTCGGKADCLGQCLSDAPDNAAVISVGTPAAGYCEAEKQTFGCYAHVEGGRLAEPYVCID